MYSAIMPLVSRQALPLQSVALYIPHGLTITKRVMAHTLSHATHVQQCYREVPHLCLKAREVLNHRRDLCRRKVSGCGWGTVTYPTSREPGRIANDL